MKKLLVLFLVGFLASCAHSEAVTALDEIESYIQERPDSALRVLESIDSLQLNKKGLRAHYSLLYAIALDKNQIDTADIHIILPALAYYTEKDNKGMLANYYAGRIYENGGDYSNALIHYHAAIEKAETDDYKYRGLIYSAIGNTYHLSYSFEEELFYYQKAFEAFVSLGDAHYTDLATFGLANAYHNNRDFRTADSLYAGLVSRGDSIRPISLASKLALADNALKSGCFEDKGVGALFESVIRSGGPMGLEDYYEYAYIQTRLGEEKKADSLLQALSLYPDSYTSYWWRYKIEQEKGNYKEAESLLESSIQLQNLVVRNIISQTVFKSLSEYYKFTALTARQEQTIFLQRSIITMALLILVFVFTLFMYGRRKRCLLAENEKLHLAVEESERMLRVMKTDADHMRAEHEETLNRIEEQKISHGEKVLNLQKMYATLYQKQFSEIGRYYDASYLGNPETASQSIVKNVAAEVDSILSEISAQSGKQCKFEERINRDAEDIIAKIRGDYPKYSEDDIRFICYVVAGFDATTISVLMNISCENARVKRYRIRHRLLADKGPNADLYKIWFS